MFSLAHVLLMGRIPENKYVWDFKSLVDGFTSETSYLAYTRFEVRPDGELWYQRDLDSGPDTTYIETGTGRWWQTLDPSIGVEHEVRITQVDGNATLFWNGLSSDNFGKWLSLSTARQVFITKNSNGYIEALVRVEIRDITFPTDIKLDEYVTLVIDHGGTL